MHKRQAKTGSHIGATRYDDEYGLKGHKSSALSTSIVFQIDSAIINIVRLSADQTEIE